MKVIDAQLPLFTQTQAPLARRRDETSQHSANWMRSSGVLAAQERTVLEALKGHAGTTSRELGRVLPFADRNVTSRRLAGLADRGLARRGPKRLCRVSGMLCFTWYTNMAGQVNGTLSASRQSVSRAEPRERGPITTPEERRQLREQLAASGDPATRRFLSELSEGVGGAKS
jgi:hypothetical protein